MKMVVWILALILLVPGLQAQSLYRWTDKEGKVHYGDKPDEQAVKPQPKRFSGPPSVSDEYLPYETRKAKQNFPVTLYVSVKCGNVCDQARAVLNKRGVPYAEKMLMDDSDVEAMKKATGANDIPTLLVGRTPLKGFEAGSWNAELDAAGYPKAAPYGYKPPQPVKQAQPATSPAENEQQ